MGDEQWETVSGEVNYVKVKELKVGATIEGIYCERTESDKYKGTFQHSFRQEDGRIKVVAGGGQLTHVLSGLPFGTKLRIVFEGKKKLESGTFKGQDANQWKVLKAKIQEKPLSVPVPEQQQQNDPSAVPF